MKKKSPAESIAANPTEAVRVIGPRYMAEARYSLGAWFLPNVPGMRQAI